jgi:hypothetical protein
MIDELKLIIKQLREDYTQRYMSESYYKDIVKRLDYLEELYFNLTGDYCN